MEKLVMSNKYSVYVPGTFLGKRMLQDNILMANEVALKMSKLFGGCTIIKGHGYWYNTNKNLVSEKVYICSSNSTDIDMFCHVEDIAVEIGKMLGQECVTVECNGVLTIITIEQ